MKHGEGGREAPSDVERTIHASVRENAIATAVLIASPSFLATVVRSQYAHDNNEPFISEEAWLDNVAIGLGLITLACVIWSVRAHIRVRRLEKRTSS